MTVRTDTQRKWEKQHALLDKLYDRFNLGDEIKGAVSQFIPEWGEWNFVYNSWKVFQAAEILLSTGNTKNPAYGVMKNREEAHESLKAEQLASVGERGSSKPREESILRHVSGPDSTETKFEVLKPLRKDESLALVEAARQYLDRKKLKAAKLKELRDGGINVPDSAIPLPRDERLETVLLTLPYIDSLLGADDRYGQLATKYRELEAAHNTMRREYDALKRWRDNQVRNAVDGVALAGTLERTLDRISDRHPTSAKTNGHAQSGEADGRAEDSAGPGGAERGTEIAEGEPSKQPVEAREAQPRSKASTAAG